MADLVVNVEQGKVRGKTMVDYHGGSFLSFSGIPYARAPIGELRFRAPEPAEPWEGIRDGTKEGYECPSMDMYFGYVIGHEDNCLNLNVYTKEIPQDNNKKKPVMVWIHGGGYIFGSNKSQYFGPHYLMTEDIVLVAINYRLGIFGFLSLEDQSLGVPGNAGLKDQVMALKWIQKNIHNFGGDANNVTIFGESAGGASVHYLTLSPLTKGLFHKAISQSGTALCVWARGVRNAAEVAKCMGYKDTTDEKSILHKLQKESARSIVNGQFKIKDTFFASHIRPLGPVIEAPSEGAFISEDPVDIIKAGKNHQVPIIFGFNSLEGIFYELIRRTRTYSNMPKTLELDVPYNLDIQDNGAKIKEVGEKIKKYYYREEEVSEENVKIRYLMTSDVQFIHGIQRAARLQKQHGSQTIYMYRMSLDGPLNFFKKFCQVKYFKTMILINFFAKLSGNGSLANNLISKLPCNNIEGVAHADDLFYLFTTFFSPKIALGSEEDLLIQKFVKTWTNFAKFGNPTPEADEIQNKVIWTPIGSNDIDTIFDINRHIRLTDNVEKDRMHFWDSLYEKYGQVHA